MSAPRAWFVLLLVACASEEKDTGDSGFVGDDDDDWCRGAATAPAGTGDPGTTSGGSGSTGSAGC